MNQNDYSILLVDDEEAVLRSLSAVLMSAGFYNTTEISDSRKVLPHLAKQSTDLALLDLSMPHLTGQELLDLISVEHPGLPVIVVTAIHDLQTAVDCMRRGAVDYIVKPVVEEQILAAVTRATQVVELQAENRTLTQALIAPKLNVPSAFDHILTVARQMENLFRYIEAVAPSSQPVLITGETGSGKELFAQAVHRASGREGRFVAVNVAGLDDNVFADTLFGHKKGSFTGATSDRPGLIEQAAGGTLFLDEIGDLNMPGQVKLLRLLQEREYYPMGSDDPMKTDTRVVVATNRNLKEMQDKGTFRKDLYYRLYAHRVDIPALRERTVDLPLLVDHFLEEAAMDLGKKVPTIPEELIAYLSHYDFPGNVRELRALIADAVSRHQGGVMSLEPFCGLVGNHQETGAEQFRYEHLSQLTHLPPLKDVKGLLIQEALRRSGNNHRLAAHLIGVTRQAISKYLKEHPELD